MPRRHVTRKEIATLFGMSPRETRGLTRLAGFPQSGKPLPVEQVLRWAANSGDKRFAGRVPLEYQPTATRPAAYVGARRADRRRVGGSHIVYLTWESQAGLIHLTYPTVPRGSISRDEAAQYASTDAYAVIAVTVFIDDQINEYLPELEIAYLNVPSNLDLEYSKSVGWDEVARVLGQPLPFFPNLMRTPERLEQWRPGAAPMIGLPTVPDCDITPLLIVAGFEEGDTPVGRTLRDLALAQQGNAILQTLHELDEVGRARAEDFVTIAAYPSVRPPSRQYDDRRVDEHERRAAWMDLFHREDELAVECLRLGHIFEGLRDAPYNCSHRFSGETIDRYAKDLPNSALAEWLDTLQDSKRTAGHTRLERWDDYDQMRYLEDPSSGAPVVEMSRTWYGQFAREIMVLIPARLTCTEPLAEVILEDLPWVRTHDGNLHIMPVPVGTSSLTWGYSGHGPSALAATVETLLADINEIPIRKKQRTALSDLFKEPHPEGTVFSRADLESYRRRPGKYRS